ncbi:MAG TPA: group 1 truncated hemoglobin [Phenylobacterium sp.]|nr:group 1 truncated hemoglobin [Phenylobacterium sp.]
MNRLPIVLALAVTLPTPALAQERPVDPYTATNANADAIPVADPELLAAFHGKDGISRIIDDMVDRAVADPKLEEIFHATDLVRLRRTLKEQVGYILGAGIDYTGRDMKATHKDQGINTAEFNALVEILQASMDKEGVPFRAQNRLLHKLAPMRRDVVTR